MLSHKEGSKLHDKIAGAYRNSIDLMEAEGEYNAALLNGARQFLKDNNILMDSGVGTPLNDLNNTLINVPFGEDDAAEA
jgi:hypothetical protein